jgi:phage terminase large subunit-like protein
VTSDIVCGQLLNGSTAVIIFDEGDSDNSNRFHSVAAAVSYALGFYHVPVSAKWLEELISSLLNVTMINRVLLLFA